ncbi:MAG: hypothetical protein MUF54_14500, partial [Polyangiaceae bacterium]|nr:hypothetical protein [Polyangiaceae bacterium]
MENRLLSLGIADIDAQIDRDGYRVRVLTPTKERLREVLNALRVVMLTPVAAGEPSLERASQRLGALRQRPLDAPEFVPFAACTGELGLVTTSSLLDPKSREGASHVERWRSASHGAARVAIAFVGPPEIG